jgi:excisionase family DNA binding protein
MGEQNMTERFMTPPQIAKILGVGADKVSALIASGELQAVNLSLGNARPRWKVDPESLRRFLAGRSNQPKATKTTRRRDIPKAGKEYV